MKNLSFKDLLLVVATVVVVWVALNGAPQLIAPAKEKTFTVDGCTTCDLNGCRDVGVIKGFKVLEQQVMIFVRSSDGLDRIRTYPMDSKMTCSILRERNFMFDCSSSDSDVALGTHSSMTIAFDGAKKLQINSYFSINGRASTNDKSTCSVR